MQFFYYSRNLMRKWNITLHNKLQTLCPSFPTCNTLCPFPSSCLAPQISFWLQSPVTSHFHSLHLSPVQCDGPWTEIKGVLLTFHWAVLFVFSCYSSKTILIPFHSAQPEQSNPGCILGMYRKLLISPEAGGGEQGHDIPLLFLRALITMTDRSLPSLKGR